MLGTAWLPQPQEGALPSTRILLRGEGDAKGFCTAGAWSAKEAGLTPATNCRRTGCLTRTELVPSHSSRAVVKGFSGQRRAPVNMRILTNDDKWCRRACDLHRTENPEVASSNLVEPAISIIYGPARTWMKI